MSVVPRHITLLTENPAVVAAAIMYLKEYADALMSGVVNAETKGTSDEVYKIASDVYGIKGIGVATNLLGRFVEVKAEEANG